MENFGCEMMNKKIMLVPIFLILIVLVLFSNNVKSQGSWIKDGDRVYVDDSNVYISANPHTLHSSGWVYLNLTSKTYSGDIDVVFGFDTSQAKPKKMMLYHPHTITWNTTSSMTFYNVSSFVTTTDPCEYGHEYNLIKRKVTYTTPSYDNSTNTTSWNPVNSVVCFDTYESLGDNDYEVTWRNDFSRVENWVDVSNRFKSINYDFGGMNKWYYVTDVSVTAGKNYLAKFYVQVPVSLTPSSGKYWIAMKPSSETIAQAISLSHLYYLDPWWNTTYGYRYNITGLTTTEYPLAINDTYGINGDIVWGLVSAEPDYVYSTASGPSGTIAIANETDEKYWENESDYINRNPSLWNDADIVFHLEDENWRDWANTQNGTGGGNPDSVDGVFGNGTDFDGDDYITVGSNLWANTDTIGSIECWFKMTSESASNQIICFNIENAITIWINTSEYLVGYYYDTSLGNVFCYTNQTEPLSLNKWYHVIYQWDADNDRLQVWLNGSAVCDNSGTLNAANVDGLDRNNVIGARHDGAGNYFYGVMDEVRVWNKFLTSDEINAHYQNGINALTGLGSEETNAGDTTPPTVTIVSPTNSTYNQYWFWANATTNEAVDWCKYSLDGGSNTSMSNTSTTAWYKNVTSSDGVHTIKFYCNDTSGNVGASSLRYFTLDKYPIVTIVSPSDGDSVQDAKPDFTFSISDEDSTLTAILYINSTGEIDYTNGSYSNLGDITSSSFPASYNAICVNDSDISNDILCYYWMRSADSNVGYVWNLTDNKNYTISSFPCACHGPNMRYIPERKTIAIASCANTCTCSGYTECGGVFYEYNVSTDTFIPRPEIPTGAGPDCHLEDAVNFYFPNHPNASIRTNLYWIGGQGACAECDYWNYSDGPNGTIYDCTDSPINHEGAMFGVVGDYGYLLGGHKDAAPRMNDIYKFDPVGGGTYAGTWTNVANYSDFGVNASVFAWGGVYGDLIYQIEGSFMNDDASYSPDRQAIYFNTSDNTIHNVTWSGETTHSTVWSSLGNGTFLYFGGQDVAYGSTIKTVKRFDISSSDELWKARGENNSAPGDNSNIVLSTNITLSRGGYKWYLKVTDSRGQTTTTSTKTLTVLGSPKWSDNSTSIPTTYDPNTLSVFNITWNDTQGYSIDTVFLESNYSGSSQNYTMTLIDPYINATENKGVYNYNLTLPAGTFYWKSYANASDGVWNVTDTWYATISKADSLILISSNVTSPITYPAGVNITGYNCPSELTCNLYRNDTGLVSNPDLVLLGVGSYQWTYNTSGNENYTSNSTTYDLKVNRGSNTLSISISDQEINDDDQAETTITANWTNTNGDAITTNCTIILTGADEKTLDMTYSASTLLHSKIIYPLHWNPGNYTANVSCTNSNYTSNSKLTWFKVIEVTGGGASGGETTPTTTTTTTIEDTTTTTIPTSIIDINNTIENIKDTVEKLKDRESWDMEFKQRVFIVSVLIVLFVIYLWYHTKKDNKIKRDLKKLFG